MKSRDKAVIVVVAFVAIIAIVGLMTFNRYEAKKRAELADVEETKDEQKYEVLEEDTTQTHTHEVEAEIVEVEEVASGDTEAESEAPIPAEELTFSESETIIWPVDGNVIINYSMDQTVFFATLNQYKYNPAIVISGEVGQPVMAATNGQVSQIRTDSQLGNMVLVDLGSGYTAVYGQLQEIRVQEGQRISQGDVIGYVGEPTKYYSVEGPNVYFQMLKDGEPVNPLNFMEE